MLATFAFDVCHDVYRAAREVIDTKIPTLNAEISGKYQWRPDRMPRLAEFICDFSCAGERALGGESRTGFSLSPSPRYNMAQRPRTGTRALEQIAMRQAEACPTGFKPSRMAMFRVYYLGGAEYHAARRHLGISELTWADWAEEIRRLVGRELARSGVFPPSRYFRGTSEKAS